MGFLDDTGLQLVWAKIKEKFLPLTGGTITGSLNVTGDLQ